jgi:hypothetical protein
MQARKQRALDHNDVVNPAAEYAFERGTHDWRRLYRPRA